MTIAVWIASGLLALLYLAAGGTKVIRPKESLAERMHWTTDFSVAQVKLVGALEVLGALGLILPALTGIAPILTPIAAIGLVLVQVGAIILHVRLKEYAIVPNVVLLLLALFVAIARFAGF